MLGTSFDGGTSPSRSGRSGSPSPGGSNPFPTARVAAVIVALLGVLIGLGIAHWTRLRNERVTAERFDATVSRVVAIVERRMATYEYGLRGARGAVVAVGPDRISREDFQRYSLTRNIEREFPGARGFGFIRRVRPGDEAAFEAAARKEGSPEFAIRQLSPHEGERYVIQYIEPVATNRQAVGLDVASEDHRRQAAQRAMETGLATVTAPITLVQASGLRERGFLIFLPVRQGASTPADQAGRETTTVGWTYVPLRIDEVLAGLGLNDEGISLGITDQAPSADIRFFGTADAADNPKTGLSRTRTAAVYGRTWVIDVEAQPKFIADLNLVSPAMTGILTSGAMLLVAILLYLHLTGRRRAILAIVEKSRLAAIVENAEDAIVGKTLDGVITDWNPAAERMFGFSAAEAVGRKAEDLIVPSRLRFEEQETLEALRLRKPVAPLTTLRLRKDGGSFPVEVSASPIRKPDAGIIGIATVIRDITERVEAAERIQSLNVSLEHQVTERTAELRAASALQRSILTHAGYAVIATDPMGTVTLFNPAAERLLGYLGDEVIGKVTPALFHDAGEVTRRAKRLSTELSRQVEPGFEAFVALTRDGIADVNEWTYITKDGLRLPVLLNVSALRSDDGQDLGFLSIAVDQSERHRHQAEMKAANAGTWNYVVASGQVQLSAECARQHGLPEVETEIDVEREWSALAHPADVPQVLADLNGAVAAGGSYTTEFRIPLPDGSVRWITSIGRVETDGAGQTVRVIGLTLDTTSRKEAEIALADAKAVAEAAQAQAERATAAKTDFLAAMSHEIRTPLNAIIGFTDLMLISGRLDPGLARQAELVRSSGSALLTIVNDILDFSKVEAGAIELDPKPFAVLALVDNCTSIVRGLADAKGLEVRMNLDAALPRWLLGDEGRLRQILINLLNNAVKFTQAGSVTLDIRHEGHGLEGDLLRFGVIDTGIGIPRDKQHRLFQRFSQVDGSIERDYGGSGLGLAICKRLVELMGGEIGVSSLDGAGSTFWFTVRLPLAAPVEAVPALLDVSFRRRTARLLLVEDSPINQELARAVLEGAGYTVETVADGEAAVRAVETGSFDLILMDVQMPGMDGMTATRLIRQLHAPAANTPVIAMTANVLPEQVKAFREAGMDDHVGKPFDRQHLFATIDRWLAQTSEKSEAVVLQHPAAAFDHATFDAISRLMAPERMKDLLRTLNHELGTSFEGPSSTIEVRETLRHRAHSLASATGMIGFVDLSVACQSLETFGENRVAEDGEAAFKERLDRVRSLASAAVSMSNRLIANQAVQRSLAVGG